MLVALLKLHAPSFDIAWYAALAGTTMARQGPDPRSTDL
jgi:hypothetical protein